MRERTDNWQVTTAYLLRVAIGMTFLVVGWAFASDELYLADQLPWLALSSAGAIISVGATALATMDLRRRVTVRLAALEGRIAELRVPDRVAPALDTGALIAVDGATLRLFHRSSCALAAGRDDIVTGAAAIHQDAGRVPCGVCRP